MKGVYLSLSGEEGMAVYRMMLDAQGKQLQREPLRRTRTS